MTIKNKLLTSVNEISENLKSISKHWDGKKSILEMKNSGNHHWKQMEWIGWYFQFLCEHNLKNIMIIPGPKYKRVSFDGLKEIPWDFKAHAINTSSHKIIINDSEAISSGINDYGSVGVILSLGKVIYNDENRSFQKWHDETKGEKSAYSLANISRGAWSRLHKVSFDLQQISFIKITDSTLIKCGSFQTDFRNSNAKPRKTKVLLDLEKIDKELIHKIEF